MYRARVEAVSGLKVRAGGKWLTCIGNRAVKAGDLVWTDGRCVYGHDREAQTPLVIVNPKKTLAIPLCLPSGWVRTSSISFTGYSVQKSAISYEHILQGTDFPEFTDPLWGIQDYTNYLMTNTTDTIIFSNAPATGRTQKYLDLEDVIGRVALNVDNDRNIYEIHLESIRTGYLTSGNFRVQIMKNKSVVHVFEIDRNEKNEGFTIPHWTTWHSLRDGIIYKSSFIENENNWWIIFLMVTEYYANSSGEFWQVALTMIDNHGKHRLFTRTSRELTVDRNIKIPMHDNFYFKINDDIKIEYPATDGYFTEDAFVLYPLKIEIPVTVYSPQDVPLMDTKIHSDTYSDYYNDYREIFYFAGYRITPNKYLIASRQDGLYLRTARDISQIFNGRIANQCLRPMKKYKYWWERIETIDEGGKENE